MNETEEVRALDRAARFILQKPTQNGMLNKLRTVSRVMQLKVTWSFDPDEAIWWCGVLDLSIHESDVMDWSEDWSYSESSPCAEDVFPEQSQALALISDDVSSPECDQQAEIQVAKANRTLAQARSAVASAKQNRSGFFPPFNVSSSRKGKGKGKVKGKSKNSSCLICGRSDHCWRQCPERQSMNDSRKDLAKEVKMDLARFIWELLGVSILNCLRLLCSKRMLSWIVVRQKQLVVSRLCRFWWMQWHKVFVILASKWTLWTDHGFVLLMVGHWGRALSRVWLTPMGWISIHTLEAENVPVPAGMNLL